MDELLRRYLTTPMQQGGQRFLQGYLNPETQQDWSQPLSFMQSAGQFAGGMSPGGEALSGLGMFMGGLKKVGNTVSMADRLAEEARAAKQAAIGWRMANEAREAIRPMGSTLVREGEDLVPLAKAGFKNAGSKIKHPFTEFVSKIGKQRVIPIDEFNGTNARIFPSQNTVDVRGVKKWINAIQGGDNTPVVIDWSERLKRWRVVDGHTKLKAYEQLGIKDIPVIDNTGGKFP